MKSFQLRVVSQEKEVLTATVDQVTVPTTEGEITVLYKHIPLFAKVATGQLTYKNGQEEGSVVVSNGFLNVTPTGEVVVLVDSGILDRDISLERAQEAVKMAHETMQKTQDQRELMMAEASLRQAMMEVKVAQKTRKTKI